jgi:hypothetical protein
MQSTLKYNRGKISTTVIEGKIYLFGGMTNSSTHVKVIECFDYLTDTINLSPTELSVGISGVSLITVNDKVYLFGGKSNEGDDIIQCFDINANVCSVMRGKLIEPLHQTNAMNINTKVFILGSSTDKIQFYDLENDTVIMDDTNLVNALSNASSVVIDNKGYIFDSTSIQILEIL